MRLNLGLFFRWTGLFILVVAAGILANSVQALHEAGLWNHLQTVVFDISATLPMDGPAGSVLAGMFGYQDAPTVSVLGAYLLYLVFTLVLFLPADRGTGTQAHFFRSQSVRLPMSNPATGKPPQALRWAVAGSVIRDDRGRWTVLLRLATGREQTPGPSQRNHRDHPGPRLRAERPERTGRAKQLPHPQQFATCGPSGKSSTACWWSKSARTSPRA